MINLTTKVIIFESPPKNAPGWVRPFSVDILVDEEGVFYVQVSEELGKKLDEEIFLNENDKLNLCYLSLRSEKLEPWICGANLQFCLNAIKDSTLKMANKGKVIS